MIVSPIPLLYFCASEKHEESCGSDVKHTVENENAPPFVHGALQMHENIVNAIKE